MKESVLPRTPPVTSPYLSVPQHHRSPLHTASSHLCLSFSLHTVSSFGSFRLSMENARTWRGCKGGQSEKPPQGPAPAANAPCKGDTAEEEDPSPGTTLLFLGAHWHEGRSSLNSVQTGRQRDRQSLAKARTACLNSQLSHKLPVQTSNLPLLRHAAGAASLQHGGPIRQ